MELFGPTDRDYKGKIKSEYPVWYHEIHVEDLRESLARNKRMLDRGEVTPSAVAALKGDIVRDESKLAEIDKNTPTLSVGERDKLYKLWKTELSPAIRDSLFTRSDMMRGVADGHEEARRMVKPVIKVSPELGKFLKLCNCKVVGGKASRNMLAKAFKLTGRLLGEATNIEVLRED